MLKAVIIDDEQQCRVVLKQLLDEFCDDVEVLAEASGIDDGISLIEEYQPDLVFLDIEMPGGTGFDLLAQIEEKDFDTIFTTAHNKYAIKAIKFSALDYLLKPIDIPELQEAVKKVRDKQDSKNADARYEVLKDNLFTEKFNKIVVSSLNGYQFIKTDEIVRCEADGSYTSIHLMNGTKILASKKIKHFEELLTDFHFYRVHNSHLVNLNQIVTFQKGKTSYITMSNDAEVPLSAAKKDGFLEKISLK